MKESALLDNLHPVIVHWGRKAAANDDGIITSGENIFGYFTRAREATLTCGDRKIRVRINDVWCDPIRSKTEIAFRLL